MVRIRTLLLHEFSPEPENVNMRTNPLASSNSESLKVRSLFGEKPGLPGIRAVSLIKMFCCNPDILVKTKL